MVKSAEAGSAVPPFLSKCYAMVDDEASDAIISWGSSNDSFVIWDMAEFGNQLLPKYFKHNNFASFMRQLNIYVSFFSFTFMNGILELCLPGKGRHVEKRYSLGFRIIGKCICLHHFLSPMIIIWVLNKILNQEK